MVMHNAGKRADRPAMMLPPTAGGNDVAVIALVDVGPGQTPTAISHIDDGKSPRIQGAALAVAAKSLDCVKSPDARLKISQLDEIAVHHRIAVFAGQHAGERAQVDEPTEHRR